MNFKILPIKGDASFREFYRQTSNDKNKIIVVAQTNKYQNLIAYTAINKFLRKNGILAPKLYEYNFNKGIIIIEDFGNKSFFKIITKKKNKFSEYKKIINLLIKIQKIKPKRKIKNVSKGFHNINKYNINHLHKESDLFFDWYLPFFFKKKEILIIKKKTNKILHKLYKKLNFSNTCFVHRDFHLQNLMKFRNKIGVIDNQDALIGNPSYDLASLVDDVRVRSTNDLKNQIINYYLKKAPKNYKIKSKEFLEDFYILSVQRCLKIIGIFARLYKRDKKKKYLKLIPNTWKILDERLSSNIFFELRKTINIYVSNRIKKKIIKK